MQKVERLTHGDFRLGPATLYTVIGRLLDEGLIVREDARVGDDERRKTYAIAGSGKQVLREETGRRRTMARLGAEALREMGVGLDDTE